MPTRSSGSRSSAYSTARNCPTCRQSRWFASRASRNPVGPRGLSQRSAASRPLQDQEEPTMRSTTYVIGFALAVLLATRHDSQGQRGGRGGGGGARGGGAVGGARGGGVAVGPHGGVGAGTQ